MTETSDTYFATPENLPKDSLYPSNPRKSPARSLYIVIGLLSFVIILVAGVSISQRQQLLRGPVAPTAPESQPAAAEGSLSSCDLVFTVQ